MGTRTLPLRTVAAAAAAVAVALVAPLAGTGTTAGAATAANSALAGVACTSATSCFAVGWRGPEPAPTTSDKALIERWNGTHWTVQASAPNGPTHSELWGIRCPAATNCIAVGDDARQHTLVEQWNGHAWKIVAAPSPTGYASLKDIACTSPQSCFAVGVVVANDLMSHTTLIEHWNGHTWSRVNHSTAGGFLQAVTCASASRCIAVGGVVDSSDDLHGLVENWNGTTWSSHVSMFGDTAFESVSCAGATSCRAVQSFGLVEHWNGSTWSHESDITIPDAQVHAILCASNSDCTAAGGGDGSTVIAHWNGTAWSQVPSPTPSGAGGDLEHLACKSPTNCNAVGDAFGDSTEVPLAEHWNGSHWTIQPTALG